MQQPAWLEAAWAEFGVREMAGAAENPAIVGYFRDAGDASVTTEATPWCAAFVGAMLKRAGVAGTGSLLARSYLDWGTPIDDTKSGAIAVFPRGNDPVAGHVGFIVAEHGDKLYVLGGNQGDAVSIATLDKSTLIGLRWPSSTVAEASVPQSDDIFIKALAHVLEMEGGFSDDEIDPGGPTNKGITLEVYANFKGEALTSSSRARLITELKAIPDATVADIYRRRYFAPAQCPLFTDPLALMQFDTAVNHGVGTAIRMLQQAVGVTADGEIGPETVGALRAANLLDLLDRYADIRRDRYRALPQFWHFGRGWLRRVDATLALAKSWAANSSTTTTLTNSATGESDMTTQTTNANQPKWWAESRTLWGTLITAASTVLPLLAPAVGVTLPADVIQTFGDQAITAVQALTGLFGTALAIYGRFTATSVLSLRKD
jgi:uncharacterized protein (TIGR02594 family)